MLQKAGWESGKGLGAEGQGIKAPVNRGPVTANNMGVGVAIPENVTKDDNEFDQYRKRMMLAYKVCFHLQGCEYIGSFYISVFCSFF